MAEVVACFASQADDRLAQRISDQESQQRQALAAAKGAAETLRERLDAREAAAGRHEAELQQTEEEQRQAELDRERYERALLNREALCTRKERDLGLR